MIVVETHRTMRTDVTELPDGTRLVAHSYACDPGQWTAVSVSEPYKCVASTVPGGKIEVFYREAAILERSTPEAHAEAERKTSEDVPPVIPQQGSLGVARQLHRSKTHAPGIDPNCPECYGGPVHAHGCPRRTE
jgi:hypothetical protein